MDEKNCQALAAGARETGRAAAAIAAGELDANLRLVELFQGADGQGRCVWAVVGIRPSRYIAYRARLAAGLELELEDYGEVLEQGRGVVPPAELQRQLAGRGFSVEFGAGLAEAVADAVAASGAA